MDFLTVPSFFACALVGWYLWRYTRSLGKLPLPPGPKSLPIIGNLFDIPKSTQPWHTYQKWHEQYGDVVYIEALGQKMLILGSADAVTDLLERRSSTYSDRPRMVMLSDLMEFDWTMAFIRYGERWRLARKMLHAHAHSGVAPRYHPVQLESAREFARDLLAAPPHPDDFPVFVRTALGAEIIKMVYGLDVGKSEEARRKYIDSAEEALHALAIGGTPGRFLVEFIPWLRYLPPWMPGSGFLRFAQDTRALHRRLRDESAQAVIDEMAAGTAPSSMMQSMLQAVSLHGQDLVKDVAATVYLASADTLRPLRFVCGVNGARSAPAQTKCHVFSFVFACQDCGDVTVTVEKVQYLQTVSSVVTFILAMVVFPDVQEEGQAEIDAIVGQDRLPIFTDYQRLPYVQAIILEALRWIPVLPLAVPHATTRDDEYRGWRIPKGTIVIGNSQVLLRDPVVYPDPEVFRPERFLRQGENGLEIDPAVRDSRTSAFGYGRRVCPGRHIAAQDLFATFATILATVYLRKAIDHDGNEITPTVEIHTNGLLSQVNPFPFRVRSRSTRAAELLDETRSAE